jgi:hypothetical protein
MFHEFNKDIMLTQVEVDVAWKINVMCMLWQMKHVKYESVK